MLQRTRVYGVWMRTLAKTVGAILVHRLTMRRGSGFLVVVGLICGGVVVWCVRRRRRSVTAARDAASGADRLPNKSTEEAGWENEGGAVLQVSQRDATAAS